MAEKQTEVQPKADHGVKETKEALQLAFLLTVLIQKQLKDGFQFTDITELFVKLQGDAANKAVLDAAIKDISVIPDEVKDIKGLEILELVAFSAQEITALLKKLKEA